MESISDSHTIGVLLWVKVWLGEGQSDSPYLMYTSGKLKSYASQVRIVTTYNTRLSVGWCLFTRRNTVKCILEEIFQQGIEDSGPVHTNAFWFENEYFFIRFRLPSTLIRSKTEEYVCENGGFRKRSLE